MYVLLIQLSPVSCLLVPHSDLLEQTLPLSESSSIINQQCKNAEKGNSQEGDVSQLHTPFASNKQPPHGKKMVHRYAQHSLQCSGNHCSNSQFMRLTQNICSGKTTEQDFRRGRQRKKKLNYFQILSYAASTDSAPTRAEEMASIFLLLPNSGFYHQYNSRLFQNILLLSPSTVTSK